MSLTERSHRPRTFLGAGLALGGAAVGEEAVGLAVGCGHGHAVLRLERPAPSGLPTLHLHGPLILGIIMLNNSTLLLNWAMYHVPA